MGLRDHQAIPIEDFNGWFKRGDADSVPLDHFSDLNNIAFVESGFETRPGMDTFFPKGDVVRLYTYTTQNTQGLLILDTQGSIYHALLDGSKTLYGPILTIAGMTDFGFQAFFGRAYITPFGTFTNDLGINYQKGLENEFVYVYKGDGTNARKAAGFPPTNATTTANQNYKSFNSTFDGVVDKGVHLVTVTFTSGLGDTLAIQVFPVIYAPGGKQIENIQIPLGPLGTTGRKIWMTHAINPSDYTSDQSSYTYYLAATIADNTTNYLRINIADSALTTPLSLGTLPTVTGLLAENTDTTGFADLGLHLIAVVYETDTGFLTALGPETFAQVNVVDLQKAIHVSNIPVSPDSFVTKRHLVATKAILNYNGDQTGYQFFFIPEGTLDNNIDTELDVSFYDADLLEDASHLIDSFSEIPAGASLNSYHNRMVLAATFDDISIAYLSSPGEPEAIDQVDGVIIFPLDGLPITNTQEYRDVLYLFKKTKTGASVDNQDVPSTWQFNIIDQGVGAAPHGVGLVLDSGGVNIDFLLVADLSGILMFNGSYSRPELTWKIQDFWVALDRNSFIEFQVLNDSLNQRIYMNIPDLNMILYADYRWGLDPKNIKWSKYTFDVPPTSIALVETDVLVIGSVGNAS